MHNVLKYQIGTIADLEEDINYLMINPTTLSRQKKKKRKKKKKKRKEKKKKTDLNLNNYC